LSDPVASARREFSTSLKALNQPYSKATAAVDPALAVCRKVAFILLDNFSMMAFTGALDTLVTANLLSQQTLYEVSSFGVESMQICSDLGINIAADTNVASLTLRDAQMVIVCGGLRSPLQPIPALVDALRKLGKRKVLLGSLWNGCFQLAHAGLLDDHACTVHPESQSSLHERYPRLQLLPQPFVVERNFISCAGANSALGMMLALLKAQQSHELVHGVEAILSCDRGEQTYDSPLARGTQSALLPATLQSILDLMENNLEDPLDLDQIAGYVKLSRRQIDRLFQQHLQSSPGRHYLELRLTRARRLLLQSNQPVVEIAIACGFVCTHHFSRCFRDYFGYTARQARARQRAGSDDKPPVSG
jgi:transcriptional regulator GlxA family with amidase domain